MSSEPPIATNFDAWSEVYLENALAMPLAKSTDFDANLISNNQFTVLTVTGTNLVVPQSWPLDANVEIFITSLPVSCDTEATRQGKLSRMDKEDRK